MTKIVEKLSPKEALDTANAVLDVFPADQLATVLKVIGLYGLNHLDEAFALSTEAVLQYPRNITLNGLRGDMLLQKGQMDAALVAYDNVLAENPDHAAALLHRASILADMGHTDLALACYDKLIALGYDPIATYIKKGNLLQRAHRTSDVRAFCDELLDSHGDDPSVVSIAGALYQQIGRLSEALACYKQVFEYGKHSPETAEKLTATINTLEKQVVSETSVSHPSTDG
jgi:tetratricopeptide (TPR) repeat protein